MKLKHKFRWWWLKKKERFPLVKRSTMVKECREVARRERIDQTETQKRLDDLIKKLTRCTIEMDGRGYLTYRVSVEFVNEMVRCGFMDHENHLLQYLSENIGHLIARELKSINFRTAVGPGQGKVVW